MNKKLSVAIVVPRFGRSLGGGAETLLKSLADNIFNSSKYSNIEVWTTCANDHRTWNNFYPPGVEIVDGIKVSRFKVDERNLDIFIKSETILHSGRALSIEEQFDWLKSGVNSKSLYEHIELNSKNFDLLIFGPYLFPITFWGALICPEKSILLPCLHDEQYAYLECFRELFMKVKGVFFNSIPEMKLAQRIYQIPSLSEKSFEIGMGFEPPKNNHITNKKGYLLYSGRKEQGKGLDFLITCYEALPLDIRLNKLKLLLIGSGKIEFRDELPVGVEDLGFVSEDEKNEIMRNALALVQPSLNESFSIVMMESWLNNTTVLVREECDVTKHHVENSGGGLWFSNKNTFIRAINALLENESLNTTLANNGKNFVENYYSWTAVTKRLDNSMRSLGF